MSKAQAFAALAPEIDESLSMRLSTTDIDRHAYINVESLPSSLHYPASIRLFLPKPAHPTHLRYQPTNQP